MLSSIERAINDKIARFRQASSIAEWRHYQGKATGAERPDYDDSSWQTVQVPITWAGAAGDSWLRRSYSVGESVQGISTRGATIEMPVMIPIHSRVFVDGSERVAEPSWLDTRAIPLVIAEDYQPNTSIYLAVQAFEGDGFGLFVASNVEVSTFEQVIFRLLIVRAQLQFTHYLAHEAPSANPTWAAAWDSAAQVLDLNALNVNNWDAWWQSAELARERLAPMADEAKKYTTHLIAHSHIDMNWLWTYDETVDVTRRDFIAVENLMQRYPEFRFSQSQASVYIAIQERHPELLPQIRQRVDEGRWDVTATTWVEGDLNMASGEALARHFLYTRPYIKGILGVTPRVCWEPDTFGHVATLPQLLRQVGIDYYYHCRAGKGQSIYWWEGLDGSRVLTFNDPYGYGGTIDANSVTMPALDAAKRYQLKNACWVYGVGDHGGGGTARDVEHALTLAQEPFLPQALLSTTIDFFNETRDNSVDLPVVMGELNTVFEGCYTSHSDTKKLNRSAENSLVSAETLATMAATLTQTTYPLSELCEAWRTTLFHQFHDILCGCAIGATYREAAIAMQPALDSAAAVQANSLQALNAAVNTGSGTGARIVVWNQLAFARTDVVRMPAADWNSAASALVDETGQLIALQHVGDDLIFVAEHVPALGFRVYQPSDHAPETDLAVTGENMVQNRFLRFHVNSASGAIDSFFDLEHKRVIDVSSNWASVERKDDGGFINRLQVHWERPHSMSAWTIGDITRIDNLLDGAEVRVTEQGPVRLVIEARQRFLNSSIISRYCLYTGLRRVDIETELDWHECGGKDFDAPMLRATFKPRLNSSVATFEIPFAALERPATGDEVPAQRWADISDAEYGLTLLNNAKYGHQAHGNTLGLTLVRASYEPDNLPDQGLQSFGYALYPHIGNWRQALSERQAASYNQPLVASVTDAHEGALLPGKSWLSCSANNVSVTAIKYAESGERAVILRLVEMHGQPATAKLRWGWEVNKVEQVTPIEEHRFDIASDEGGCEVPMLKHEIVTLKLWLI
ncbi:MAG: alpha-mannosidase [Chloroflexi bacterium]|nr:alpha-mannosidase [Chloroflexota bacterium]